jgi:hypothetical protein
MKVELGKIIPGYHECRRDAVHVAVLPIIAGEYLKPGEWAHVAGRSAYKLHGDEPPHGVVDPFLTRPVNYGEAFWLFMKPETVRDLRHDWSHPDFPDGDTAGSSEYDFDDSGCPGC